MGYSTMKRKECETIMLEKDKKGMALAIHLSQVKTSLNWKRVKIYHTLKNIKY